MKASSIFTCLSAAAVLANTSFVQAQVVPGPSLTPPGAPVALFKTLDQMEPRTPIAAAPFTISQSGSYYLTGNVTVASGTAITIAANGVTLDLNGFTISSTDASNTGAGIQITNASAWRDITITNGHIRGAVAYNSGDGTYSGNGFGDGITHSGSPVPQNVQLSRISVSGCRFNGISLTASPSTVVESCTVRTVGGSGISASTVKDCAASECGGSGAIFAVDIFGSRGDGTGGAIGISGSNVLNCTGVSVSGTGITAASNATNSTGSSTSGTGLTALNAQNCFGRTTSGTRGMNITGTASFCRGRNDAVAGVAIEAAIAIGCTAQAGTITSPSKHLGTP